MSARLPPRILFLLLLIINLGMETGYCGYLGILILKCRNLKNSANMSSLLEKINPIELTINELMQFKNELTFDRKLIMNENAFGTRLSVDDFIDVFGIRPINFKISVREVMDYYIKSLKSRIVHFVRSDDKIVMKYKGIVIMTFDYSVNLLVHPNYVNEFMQFFKVFPVEVIRNTLEWIALQVVDHHRNVEELIFEITENYGNLTLLESINFTIFLGEEILDLLYEQNLPTNPKHKTLFFFCNMSNIDPAQLVFDDGIVVSEMTRNVNADSKNGEPIELEFRIAGELEPHVQTVLPSRAELERDYKDYLQANKNNKAGIPKDKKKTKKMKLDKYRKTNNLQRKGFNFYNPNPQKNRNNITENSLEVLRFCSKFVKKVSGFWTSGVQNWLNRYEVNINEVLQLFSQFRQNETGSDDDTAIGSMTNFYYSKSRVHYYPLVAYQADDMEDAWNHELQSHYSKNAHHPEHWNEMMDVKSTIELWFDLLSSAMRIAPNANDAFYLIHSWVFDYVDNKAKVKSKFSKLNPYGTVFFISIVANRGLSKQNCQKVHPRLRNAPLTEQEKKVDLLKMYNNNYFAVRTPKATKEFLELPKVKDYLNETYSHIELVNRELVKYRISPRHDQDKLEFQNIVAYVYKWSWPKLQGTSGDSDDDDDDFSGFLNKKEKKFSSGSRDDVVVEETNEGLLTRAKNSIAHTFNKMHGKIMSPISGPLQKAADKALEMLQHMSGLFEDIYNKIRNFFSSVTGLPLPQLSSVTLIVQLVMDYLIFINVDNVLLKSAVIMSALSKIGISKILEKASGYFKDFVNFENIDNSITGELEGTSDEKESQGFWSKLVEWVTDINPKNAGIIAGILVSGLVGYSVFKEEPTKIKVVGKKIVDGMRSMSFVGMGFVGIGNIVKYIASLFKEVAYWIKSKCGLLSEEDKKSQQIKELTKQVLQWAMRLDFYFSGEGLSLIKNNKKEFEKAKEIAKFYFHYNAMIYDDTIGMPIDLKREIKTRLKKAIDLLNYLHRLDASTHFRVTPFHMQFFGQPGVGKSEMLKEIIKRYHSRYFSNCDINKFVYSPNTNKEHWDGYWGQLCIVIDEMWSTLDPETLTEWLTIISCMPVLLPMAALEDKIDAYFRGKLIVSCTNVAYPKANGVACMVAVWRRRMLIEVKIDQDVYDKSTGSFSMSLYKKKYKDIPSNHFPHLTFTIMRSVPTDSGETYYTEGAVMPDGVKWPTNNLKFSDFMDMSFSCYDALQKKELDKTYDTEEVFDEWDAMMSDIINAFGRIPFRRERDFVTTNRNYIKIENIPSYTTEVTYEGYTFEIQNPQLEINIEQEVDDIVIEKCLGSTGKIVVYTVGEEVWRINFRDKVVDKGNGVIEPLTNEHRKAIVKISPIFSEDLKRRMEQLEGTALEKNHTCKPEKIVPDILSTKECVSMNLNISQYLEHARICRAGKYSFESIVDFTNLVRFRDTPETVLEERNRLRDEGKRYKAYRISLMMIEDAELQRPQVSVNYCHFIGNAELYEGKPVPNFDRWKKTYVKLDPYYESVMIDLAVGDSNKLDATKTYSWEDFEHNWLSDWDRIFLTSKEREKIFNNRLPERLDISYCFLEHLEYDEKNDQYYLVWSKKMSYYASIIAEKINKDMNTFDNVEPYEISYLMFFKWFAQSYEQWFLLTKEERKYLMSTQSIRNVVYQNYRRGKFYVFNVIKKAYEMTLGKFFGTIKYIWNKYFWFFKTLGLVGSAYAAIYLFRNFGELFGGKVEGTSRVFFKKPSQVVTGLQGTSQNEDNFLIGISGNILECKYKTATANAIGIGEHTILVNNHFISSALEEDIFKILLRPTARSLEWVEYVIKTEETYRIPETDLVILFSKTLPVYRRIIKKFRTEEQMLKHTVKDLNLYYNLNGSIHVSSFPFVEMNECIGYDQKGMKIRNVHAIHYKGQPPTGSSGGILYSVDNYCGNYIVGIQCWRDKKMGYGNLLTQEMLNAALKKFADKLILHEGPYECIEGTSATEQLITEHIIVEGIVPQEHIVGEVFKSSFVKTPIADRFPSARIPAVLKWNDPRVPQGTHPLQHSVNKSGRDVMRPLEQDRLDYATSQISLYYQEKMRRYPIKLLTFEECLIGLPESGNVSLNTKTSPGIPWIYKRTEPGKKSFIAISEIGELEFCADEVKEEFNKIEKSLKNGVIPSASMYEFPKDELRPIAKALGPPIKTRSITVMNFIFNLIWRKYHMSFETYLHQEADGTNVYCIGINPESMSWQRMFDCFKTVGDSGCDLDVGNWDGHYTPQLMYAANQVSNEVYYSHRLGDEKVRECLIEHNVFGCFQFLDIVCRKMRGLPSGCAGTPHLNTLGHFILQFYIFCELFENKYERLPTILEFQKYVCLRLYGDDVAMSISPIIIDWWNGTTISERYSFYGWPTTSAKKTENPNQIIPCEDITFLKRAFVLHENYGIIVGALDKDVIVDLLHWMRRTANGDEQFYDNVRNALEYSWFHGRSYYMQIYEKIQEALISEKMHTVYYTYEYMTSEMLNRLRESLIVVGLEVHNGVNL